MIRKDREKADFFGLRGTGGGAGRGDLLPVQSDSLLQSYWSPSLYLLLYHFDLSLNSSFSCVFSLFLHLFQPCRLWLP